MDHTRRKFVHATAGGAFVVVFAGCSGSGGGATPTEAEAPSETPEPMDTATGTAAATGTGTGTDTAAAVRVRSLDSLGDVLVDGGGTTLYVFDSDERGAGASTCTGGCPENWPPLAVEGEPTAGAGVTAPLSTFERDDGVVQVAANGWPLYYFAGDDRPGDANGQAVGGVWWVVRPDGTPVRDGTGTDTSSY